MIYEYNQNNSGGSFVVTDKVCHRLFIEADSASEANYIAEELGCYWDGVDNCMDCSCCGDRWYKCSNDDGVKIPMHYTGMKTDITFETIEDYAQYLADQYGWTKPDCRIFYKDGAVKEIFSDKIK